jgi:hypothetical protein
MAVALFSSSYKVFSPVILNVWTHVWCIKCRKKIIEQIVITLGDKVFKPN